MIREKTIKFEGRNGSRDDFRESFLEELDEYISLEESENPQVLHMLRVLVEIVTNIYDHNSGWGYLRLKELEGGVIEFEMGNSEIPESEKVRLTEYPDEKTWRNYGLGLEIKNGVQCGVIFGYAETIGLSLSLDIPAGYIFRGVFKR